MGTSCPRSVHALVRLLKSSIDTPGPSKIEIASLAWSDSSLHAANKAEVIGEWILTLLGQAKKTRREEDASSTLDPIADSRYWTLLCDVLTTPPPTAPRPVKTWLLPLLNRFRLDTIVIKLLTLRSSEVLDPARVALAVLWPLGEKKVDVDALADCLVAVFDACTEWGRVDDNLRWICSTVVIAYRNALENAGNKKKLYTSFLATHLSSWLRVICTSSSLVDRPAKQLQDSIYAAGTDTLFSLDVLRQPLDTLFDALSSTIRSLLPVLPKLFTSFLGATHKHRSALFLPATSVVGGKEEVRRRGMEFVGRCWTLIRDSADPQEDVGAEKWKSFIGILKVVEKERLFVSQTISGIHSDVIKGEYGGELALKEARNRAVEMLEVVSAPSKGHVAEQVLLSIQCLDVLVQIEYDLVGSVLVKVLSAFIDIPPSLLGLTTTASSEFLTHVLEYHTKTRTVHTYALALLNGIATGSALPTSLTLKPRSIFPLVYHLPALAHALRTSLTLTQTAPLATAVLQAVESAWKAFKNADAEERSTKKRRVSGTNEGARAPRLVPVRVRLLSFTGRVAGTILSNLPASAYSKDEECSLEHLWHDVGKLGWTVIWDCLREDIGRGQVSMNSKESKKRKQAIETDPPSALYLHIMASAAFRFLYDVRARVSILLDDYDWLGEAHVERLLNVVRDEASDPELVLEIIRTLLWHVWYTDHLEYPKQMETRPIFNVILDILTAHPLSKSKWSGVSADLTRDNLGLAVLYVLTERWIDVFDSSASTETIERLIPLLFVVSLDPSDEDARDGCDPVFQGGNAVITLRAILLSLLRNALFWELHNIRAVFLTSVLTQTAPLSLYCFPTAESESPSRIADTDLTIACNVYNLLHYVHPEYFTRPVRMELVKRAMAADVQICLQLDGVKRKRNEDKSLEKLNVGTPIDGLETWSHRLTFVRVFLQQMGQFLGAPNPSISLAFINHLLRPPLCVPSYSKALTHVTLDLIQLYVVSLIRSQEPEAAMSIRSVISTLISTKPFSQPKSQETWAHVIVQSSILKLVEHVTSEFDLVSLPDRVRCMFKTLLEALESVLSPHVERWVEKDVMEHDQSLLSQQINAWSWVLSLRQWLGLRSQTAAFSLGLKLTTSMIQGDSIARVDCPNVLRLLLQELWCMPDAAHGVHLDVLVSFYAVNGGDRGSDLERTMDIHITQAAKKISAEDFSHLLDVLGEGIGGSGLRAVRRERLIHLGQVVLHDIPQGTLKIVQQFATRCFDLFTDREEIHGGSSYTKLLCLEFIARHCSDRPAAIRSIDLGCIWSLLNKILSGSSEHDATTAFPVFHHIVAIIGALIRLRRDLVVHTLPHLSLVLRQLMMLTRKIRPQLGAKQSKIVTDTFPSWLSACQPLSTDEARAFARLLVSLTTKTIPRTHAYASTESQKAESLAKPFAKHASYVLVAYVDAFNDPLCIINAESRGGLEPGLFALCEMVGEHSRDALMVSALDSGGKAILKSLWNEYEKQRYVGQG